KRCGVCESQAWSTAVPTGWFCRKLSQLGWDCLPPESAPCIMLTGVPLPVPWWETCRLNSWDVTAILERLSSRTGPPPSSVPLCWNTWTSLSIAPSRRWSHAIRIRLSRKWNSFMLRLQNKTALITGGGSGIGLAVARGFLDEGARVVITGRDEAKLSRAAETLKGGDRLIAHAADVASVEQVQALVQRVTERFGPVDLLV